MNFVQITNSWNAVTDKYARLDLTANVTLNVTTGDKGILLVKQDAIGGHKLYISGRKRNGSEINLLPNSETLLCFVNVLGVLNWDIMPTEVNESAPEVETPPTPTNLNFEGVTIPTYVSGTGFGGVLKVETVNIAECTRINQNANIKGFDFHLRVAPISGMTEFFINVLRNSGGNFSLIHKVQIPIASLAQGNNSYTLPSSFPTLQGDYISFGYVSTTVQPTLISMCTDAIGGKYVTAPPSYTTPFAWLTKSQTNNYAPIIAIKE